MFSSLLNKSMVGNQHHHTPLFLHQFSGFCEKSCYIICLILNLSSPIKSLLSYISFIACKRSMLEKVDNICCGGCLNTRWLQRPMFPHPFPGTDRPARAYKPFSHFSFWGNARPGARIKWGVLGHVILAPARPGDPPDCSFRGPFSGPPSSVRGQNSSEPTSNSNAKIRLGMTWQPPLAFQDWWLAPLPQDWWLGKIPT